MPQIQHHAEQLIKNTPTYSEQLSDVDDTLHKISSPEAYRAVEEQQSCSRRTEFFLGRAGTPSRGRLVLVTLAEI